jgi:hypothetical protein
MTFPGSSRLFYSVLLWSSTSWSQALSEDEFSAMLATGSVLYRADYTTRVLVWLSTVMTLPLAPDPGSRTLFPLFPTLLTHLQLSLTGSPGAHCWRYLLRRYLMG